MNRSQSMWGLSAAVLLFAGCGPTSVSGVIEKQIDDMNAMAALVDSGATDAQLRYSADRMKDNVKSMEWLKPTDNQLKAAWIPYTAKYDAAYNRLGKAFESLDGRYFDFEFPPQLYGFPLPPIPVNVEP